MVDGFIFVYWVLIFLIFLFNLWIKCKFMFFVILFGVILVEGCGIFSFFFLLGGLVCLWIIMCGELFLFIGVFV